MERETPCSTTGLSRRTASSTARGRPPSKKKFSLMASTQSTATLPARNSAKCSLRRPMPWPSDGSERDMEGCLVLTTLGAAGPLPPRERLGGEGPACPEGFFVADNPRTSAGG